MAASRGLLLDAVVLLLAMQPRLLLWQAVNSSAAASQTQVPPGPPKDPFKESSQHTTQGLQVVLQVLPAAELSPYVEGLWLTLEAHIQLALNGTMKLYVDECVGTQSQHLNRSQRMYALIFNQGCLSIGPRSGPWSRKDNETLHFSVEAFTLNDDVEEDEVYIICWMSIWSWTRPFEPGRKSCLYNTSSYSSCRTLKDRLVAVLAFTCGAERLTLLLLSLRVVLQGWLPCSLGSLWGGLREHTSSMEDLEMESVHRAVEGPLSEEGREGATQSTSEEDLETVAPSEDY